MKPFFAPKFVDHEICGTPVKFYTISITTTFKLKKFAKEISAAIAAFTHDTSRDCHQVESNFLDPDGTSGKKFEDRGIQPAMAELRANQKSDAIQGLIEAFADTKNMALLAEIVMSSMRDEYPPGHQDNPTPEQFLQDAILEAWPDMATGVIKANKGVLGPLSKVLGRLKDQHSPESPLEDQPPSSAVMPES